MIRVHNLGEAISLPYSQFLEPFFTDGILSPEEREQIKTYEARLIDDFGHLVPSAMPNFIRPVNSKRVGKAE